MSLNVELNVLAIYSEQLEKRDSSPWNLSDYIPSMEMMILYRDYSLYYSYSFCNIKILLDCNTFCRIQKKNQKMFIMQPKKNCKMFTKHNFKRYIAWTVAKPQTLI